MAQHKTTNPQLQEGLNLLTSYALDGANNDKIREVLKKYSQAISERL